MAPEKNQELPPNSDKERTTQGWLQRECATNRQRGARRRRPPRSWRTACPSRRRGRPGRTPRWASGTTTPLPPTWRRTARGEGRNWRSLDAGAGSFPESSSVRKKPTASASAEEQKRGGGGAGGSRERRKCKAQARTTREQEEENPAGEGGGRRNRRRRRRRRSWERPYANVDGKSEEGASLR